MPEVSLRQTSMYPFLQVAEPSYEGELSLNIPRGPIAVYKTAMRALQIAELEILQAAEEDLRELEASVPSPKDRLARNRRARAVQLLDRMLVLKASLEQE